MAAPRSPCTPAEKGGDSPGAANTPPTKIDVSKTMKAEGCPPGFEGSVFERLSSPPRGRPSNIAARRAAAERLEQQQ
eukprot:COSAG01_NODE_18369_length_1080_cov_5.747197_1_plen_76_part_01